MSQMLLSLTSLMDGLSLFKCGLCMENLVVSLWAKVLANVAGRLTPLCLLILLLGIGDAVYAQTLPAPSWQVGNPTQSANGVYTVRWNKPLDADYVRINEIGPNGASNF